MTRNKVKTELRDCRPDKKIKQNKCETSIGRTNEQRSLYVGETINHHHRCRLGDCIGRPR